jgi:hypothetical protein
VAMGQCFFSEDRESFHVIPGDMRQIVSSWSYGPIDFLFEDADHTRCRKTIEEWMPYLAPHAAIAIHDVHPIKTYGIDGPGNTVCQLIQEGWKILHGGPETILRILTRDPEWWTTRKEAINDIYNAGSGLESNKFGLSSGGSTTDPIPDSQVD